MAILLPETTIFSSYCYNSSSNHLFLKKGNPFFCSTIASAKKNNLSENQNNNPKFLSTTFLAQSASVIFALGFLDAGYSGDWSRIGAISKETEDLLRVAAFLVVPFCLFAVLWLSNKSKEVS